MDLRRAGKGYKVKAFSSLELAACWERVAWKIDALEGREVGVRILILLSNSWFEFLSTSISCSLPHKSVERKNLCRRNWQHKNPPSIPRVLYLWHLCYTLDVKH